jgi:CRP-like cAMP-binding protein
VRASCQSGASPRKVAATHYKSEILSSSWPPQRQDSKIKADECQKVVANWYLSERFVKELFPNNMTLDYPRRAVIFFQGSPADVIYWLGKGIVDLYRPTNDGKLPQLRMAGPGEMIGYFDSFDKNGNLVHAFEARARTHCQVMLVTRQNINNVLQTLERTKLIELLWHLNRAWSEEALRWIVLTTSDCRQRLKLAVADLAARFGARDARGILLVPEVSHQDFANLVGCSRAMASRLIVEMIEAGDLVREGGHYIVANGSELAT